MDKETIFNNKPEDQAKIFENLGCEWIHIVDLNGAFDGLPVNHKIIDTILNKIKIPIQLGGGIRTIETVEYWIEKGVARVILGTVAIRDPELVKRATKEFPGKIAVGIDAKNGFVATDGWALTTTIKSIELAKKYEDDGVSLIVYTDIDRDGMMAGPNIEQTASLADTVSIPIIASGGISSLEDLKQLRKSVANLNGVISGRAIYDEIFRIEEAIKILR